jgi:ArsR family transcriptional regulator
MLDRTIRALADPTRREILRGLREGDLTAGEISGRFPITAASVSHHLAVLREAELVTVERRGKHLVYSLNTTVMHEFMQGMLDLFGTGEER